MDQLRLDDFDYYIQRKIIFITLTLSGKEIENVRSRIERKGTGFPGKRSPQTDRLT